VSWIPKTLTAIAVGVCLITAAPTAYAVSNVGRVVDGDTITMSDGEKIRLVQIDTPELGTNECFAIQAKNQLSKLLNRSGKAVLKADPNLDAVDRYGRSLRYIFIGKTNINLRMVEIGAAAPYFYRSELGIYSTQLLRAAERAKKNNLGLWKACPGTKLNPIMALETKSFSITQSLAITTNKACEVNYSGCLPVVDDLDCKDLKQLNLAPVRVVGVDRYKLDNDGDGIGCDK